MSPLRLLGALLLLGCACTPPASSSGAGTVQVRPASGLDRLTPVEVAAAANVLVVATASAAGRTKQGTHPLYDVVPRRILFDVHGGAHASHLSVAGDDTREIPVGRPVVLALTRGTTTAHLPYRLTWRVLAIGTLDGGDLRYSDSGGRTFRYDVARDRSGMGCFFAPAFDSNACRRALLAGVGVRTSAERSAYDALLGRTPFANLLWMLVYRRTRSEFPNKVCAGSGPDCASEASFARRSDFHPLN